MGKSQQPHGSDFFRQVNPHPFVAKGKTPKTFPQILKARLKTSILKLFPFWKLPAKKKFRDDELGT